MTEQQRHDFKAEAVISQKMDELKAFRTTGLVERAIAIDINTGEIIYDALGDRGQIDVSRDFSDDSKPLGESGKAEFLKRKPQTVIDIHTHVWDGAFSAADWAAFSWPQVMEFRLISDAVYSIRKTGATREMRPDVIRARYEEIAKVKRAYGLNLKQVAIQTSEALANELGVLFTVFVK